VPLQPGQPKQAGAGRQASHLDPSQHQSPRQASHHVRKPTCPGSYRLAASGQHNARVSHSHSNQADGDDGNDSDGDDIDALVSALNPSSHPESSGNILCQALREEHSVASMARLSESSANPGSPQVRRHGARGHVKSTPSRLLMQDETTLPVSCVAASVSDRGQASTCPAHAADGASCPQSAADLPQSCCARLPYRPVPRGDAHAERPPDGSPLHTALRTAPPTTAVVRPIAAKSDAMKTGRPREAISPEVIRVSVPRMETKRMDAMIARFRANPPRPSRHTAHPPSSTPLSADVLASNPRTPTNLNVEGQQPGKASAHTEQPVMRVASGLRTEPPRRRHRCDGPPPPAPPPTCSSSKVSSHQDWLPVSTGDPSPNIKEAITIPPLQPYRGDVVGGSISSELSKGSGTDAGPNSCSASTAAPDAAMQPARCQFEGVDGSPQDVTDEGTSVEQLLHRCRLLLSQETPASFARHVPEATSDVCLDLTRRVVQSSAYAPHASRFAEWSTC
jgi:hypothetical protein